MKSNSTTLFDFIRSRFGISSNLSQKNIKRVIYALDKIFPLDEPKVALRRLRNIFFSYIAWRHGLLLNNIKPSIIQVETVRGCNFNCIMCRAGEIEKKLMNLDDFKTIIDKLPEAFVLIMNLWGEPFISKDILKMVRYASSKAIVNIFSNFSLLPDPKEIVNSGLYEINASIDTFDREKFSRIRERGKLEVVVSNLQRLIETREKLGRIIPIISINSVLAKENVEDAKGIIENAIRIGVDRVKFQRLLFDLPNFHIPSEEDRKFANKLKRKYKDKIEVILNNFEDSGDSARSYCYLAYFMISISVEGEVLPCCMIPPILSELRMGNIFSGKEEIFAKRGIFIKNFRKKPPSFCKTCPLYYRE